MIFYPNSNRHTYAYSDTKSFANAESCTHAEATPNTAAAPRGVTPVRLHSGQARPACKTRALLFARGKILDSRFFFLESAIWLVVPSGCSR